MLALGFLHGLGADHLMAIAALSLATPLGPARYARAFGLALRFAVGHAVLLALGAGLVLFFGWQIPVRFEQGGEFIGGCLLIAPNEMRGRVMSIYLVAFRGGMPLGSLASGYFASVSSAPQVIAFNGVALLAVSVYFLLKTKEIRAL